MDQAASREETIARLTAKRDNARWSAVVGFGLLFAASFSTAFVLGGVAMIGYGAAASIYWSRRLHRLKGDPWQFDPDLDGPQAPAWSREGKPAPPHEDEHDGHDADRDADVDGEDGRTAGRNAQDTSAAHDPRQSRQDPP